RDHEFPGKDPHRATGSKSLHLSHRTGTPHPHPPRTPGEITRRPHTDPKHGPPTLPPPWELGSRPTTPGPLASSAGSPFRAGTKKCTCTPLRRQISRSEAGRRRYATRKRWSTALLRSTSDPPHGRFTR